MRYFCILASLRGLGFILERIVLRCLPAIASFPIPLCLCYMEDPSSLPLFSHLNISFLIQPLEYTIDAISDFMRVTELFLFPPQLGMHASHGVLKSCFLWQAIQHS